jgi:hypothetical protein
MNVDFCNSKAFKIENGDLMEKVMLECDTLFQMSLKRGHFPGPQPVAIEKKDLPITEEYMVCEKSDGERAILILININNKPMCFIINRNNDFYFLDLSFKREVYEGSIFDGELIKTKSGSWNLLIHDCMVYNGNNFCEKPHRIRYACIIDFILKRYVNKKEDCVNIKTKLFYKLGTGLEKTWDHIKKTTENNIDGLIFTPVIKPFIFGRDNSLFKWKLINTVDFQVIFKNKKVSFNYIKKGQLVEFKTYTPSSENYKNTKEFTKSIKSDPLIIEFKILGLESFEPYRHRSDKSIPNGEITVLNTFKNVQESITLKEIGESIKMDKLVKSFEHLITAPTHDGGTTTTTNIHAILVHSSTSGTHAATPAATHDGSTATTTH